ncbi:MAG: hypothetical protein IT452_18010 [Planctomycetia bacterium]|nr:hypothetical protein [Planctomycetia bacterium]
MRRLLLLLALALSCLPVAAEEAVRFQPPEGSKKEDVQKCAAAFEKRLAAYGYDGIKGSVEESEDKSLQVVLKSESGWTAAMLEKATSLARLPAKTVEIRQRAELTDVQREQFKPGKWDSPKDDKAPKGMHWFRNLDADTLAEDVSGPAEHRIGTVTLLRDDTTVRLTEMGKPRATSDGDKRITYTLASGAAKRLRSAFVPGNGCGMYFVIDGKAVGKAILDIVGIEDSTRDITVSGWESELRLIEAVIHNPFPFALKPVAADKEKPKDDEGKK